MKSLETSSTMSTETFETPAAVNLRPPRAPPVEFRKSLDEYDVSPKPIVPPKKMNTAQISATQYSIADLQIATDSFSAENLLGEGSIGRVYRAQFEDGKVIYSHVSNVAFVARVVCLISPQLGIYISSSIALLHIRYCCRFVL